MASNLTNFSRYNPHCPYKNISGDKVSGPVFVSEQEGDNRHQTGLAPKRLRMDASTPVSYRQTQRLDLSSSPVPDVDIDLTELQLDGSSEGESCGNVERVDIVLGHKNSRSRAYTTDSGRP